MDATHSHFLNVLSHARFLVLSNFVSLTKDTNELLDSMSQGSFVD